MNTAISVQGLFLYELLRRGATYGLDLIERVKERTGLEVGQGAAYPALHAMRKAGLLEEIDGEQVEMGRRRIYYALTSEGLTEAMNFDDVLHRMLR